MERQKEEYVKQAGDGMKEDKQKRKEVMERRKLE